MKINRIVVYCLLTIVLFGTVTSCGSKKGIARNKKCNCPKF